MVRKAVRITQIRTDNKAVRGLPFMGETMLCCVCGKEQKSDPAVESGWTHISIDGMAFYVCPDELPQFGETQDAYAKAYRRIFTIIRSKLP